MKPRSQKATAAEKARYEKLKNMGCIATRLKWGYFQPADIQHLTSGGRRISNMHTIPLSPWLHRGLIPMDCKTSSEATNKYGPSFAKSRKQFEETFGAEEYLLSETNRLLERM